MKFDGYNNYSERSQSKLKPKYERLKLKKLRAANDERFNQDE